MYILQYNVKITSFNINFELDINKLFDNLLREPEERSKVMNDPGDDPIIGSQLTAQIYIFDLVILII